MWKNYWSILEEVKKLYGSDYMTVQYRHARSTVTVQYRHARSTMTVQYRHARSTLTVQQSHTRITILFFWGGGELKVGNYFSSLCVPIYLTKI